MTKKCLIISNGPVPTPENTKVEGGGLRCWGLAKGITANKSNIKVTVAYNESYKQDSFTDKFEDIDIALWNINTVSELLAGFDTVIVSYCMGDLSTMVANTLRPDQQLILDCYVPIYVEASARETNDLANEYYAFSGDVGRWAEVLKRGDYFLCASEQQKNYYFGVLSAVGKINPATYGQDLIGIVPYGIYEKPEAIAKSTPVTDRVGKKVKKILWFGGIYPWFDLRNLVKAAAQVNEETPVTLTIVGAKNPFNNHPDFIRRYEELESFIASDKKFQDVVHIQDWVNFDDRADWYLDSDLVVVINKIGDENKLAWRTRLVDFMWASLPVVTNGGDPLGEQLLANNAAARIMGLESQDISKAINELLVNAKTMEVMRKNMSSLKKQYYWDVVTKGLVKIIENHIRPNDVEKFGIIQIESPSNTTRTRINKLIIKAKKVPAYAKKHGLGTTFRTLTTTVEGKFKTKVGKKRESKVLFFSHQLDNSGAPFVIIDTLQFLKQKYSDLPLEFHTFNPTHPDNIRRLNRLGVKPFIHVTKDIGFEFVKGDVAIFNTVAFSQLLRDSIYSSLEKNIANKMIWYIHEDEPELQFDTHERARIKRLLDNDRLVIFIAAIQTARNYRLFFDNDKNIRIQDHKVITDKKFHRVLKPDEFNELRFILPGTVSDGRKGQMPLLYAFAAFKKFYYDKQPDIYRDFTLTYVGMYSDFLSRQILNHAEKALGKHFTSIGHVTHERCLELDFESNITLCYSMRECLPLFVFEGMITGHPILRNDSSGVDEQLRDGINGYLLKSNDFWSIVDTLEQIHNKNITSNKDLAKMSKESYKIAKELEEKTYDGIALEIKQSYNSTSKV